MTSASTLAVQVGESQANAGQLAINVSFNLVLVAASQAANNVEYESFACFNTATAQYVCGAVKTVCTATNNKTTSYLFQTNAAPAAADFTSAK